jgi:hypothetical protein
MRERLIDLIVDAENKIYQEKPYSTDTERIAKVADHLLANGVIVPPMALEQICYAPHSYHPSNIEECRVSSITQKADGSFKIRLTNLRGRYVFEITLDKIGKTVFLTREEAEKALAEREGKG